ncbi:hypothetical protein ACVBIO_21375 [Shewanella sp. 0m-8]
MNYREIQSSKDVGIGMIKGGAFIFFLFSLVHLYIVDQNGTLEVILESSFTAGKFWGALALYSFFQLCILLFCGLLFYRGIKEIKANADWEISVENNLVSFKSPSPELQGNHSFNVFDLLLIEKSIKDIGDGDESIIWKFILKNSNSLELKYFGSLCLDSLANYLNVSCNIEYKIRNFDIRDQEI